LSTNLSSLLIFSLLSVLSPVEHLPVLLRVLNQLDLIDWTLCEHLIRQHMLALVNHVIEVRSLEEVLLAEHGPLIQWVPLWLCRHKPWVVIHTKAHIIFVVIWLNCCSCSRLVVWVCAVRVRGELAEACTHWGGGYSLLRFIEVHHF
jgi:hypothetical protein